MSARRGARERAGVGFCTRGRFGRALAGEERGYVRLACSGISAERLTLDIARGRSAPFFKCGSMIATFSNIIGTRPARRSGISAPDPL